MKLLNLNITIVVLFALTSCHFNQKNHINQDYSRIETLIDTCYNLLDKDDTSFSQYLSELKYLSYDYNIDSSIAITNILNGELSIIRGDYLGSLKHLLKAKDGVNTMHNLKRKIDYYLTLSRILQYYDRDIEALNFIWIAEKIARKSSEKMKIDILIEKGNVFFSSAWLDSAKKIVTILENKKTKLSSGQLVKKNILRYNYYWAIGCLDSVKSSLDDIKKKIDYKDKKTSNNFMKSDYYSHYCWYYINTKNWIMVENYIDSIQIQNCLQTKQDSITFLSLLGEIKFSRGEYKLAKQIFGQALQLSLQGDFTKNRFYLLNRTYATLMKLNDYKNVMILRNEIDSLTNVYSQSDSFEGLKIAYLLNNSTDSEKNSNDENTSGMQIFWIFFSISICLLSVGIVMTHYFKTKRNSSVANPNMANSFEPINNHIQEYLNENEDSDTECSEISIPKSNKTPTKRDLNILNNKKLLTDGHRYEFLNLYTIYYPEYYNFICSNYKSILSKNDIIVIFMMKLNSDTTYVSNRLGISKDSVNVTLFRLKRKIGVRTSSELFELLKL